MRSRNSSPTRAPPLTRVLRAPRAPLDVVCTFHCGPTESPTCPSVRWAALLQRVGSQRSLPSTAWVPWVLGLKGPGRLELVERAAAWYDRREAGCFQRQGDWASSVFGELAAKLDGVLTGRTRFRRIHWQGHILRGHESQGSSVRPFLPTTEELSTTLHGATDANGAGGYD